ncbi:tyrosine-type recombinase/integrase [Aestuariicella hydrocarbonica]|uniref:Tyrosine-type recombinase/integrase n=1 Tax=Pseudomaricurvus hydrocarbonicus TaxID=1470433 RepID=A0A9E5T3M0_9GAMM|nr:tyrosine-type recombinase/integrase [Aestuariicella hydrocarbonica]NHO67114.1 tyrosine-type recombinase/integrase [Aestuariicella hydrocarbonica]
MNNKPRQRLTAITNAKADKFASSAGTRSQLSCANISGFHLVKNASSASWRYRYTDSSGVRKQITIGQYPAMLPQTAAAIAAEWNSRGADPLGEKEKQRSQQLQQAQEAGRRTLRNYLDGQYSRTLATFGEKKARAYRSEILFSFETFLDRDMATLTRRDMGEWQTRIEKQKKRYKPKNGSSPFYDHNTITRFFGLLRALLNQAVKDEVLEVNPIQGFALKPPVYNEAVEEKERRLEATRRMLTPSEMTQLLIGLNMFGERKRAERRNSRAHGKAYLQELDSVEYPHWFVPFCRLSMSTGWRPGDIYALRWEEVDLRFSGKLRKYSEKSKATARRKGKAGTLMEVPLSANTKQLLQAWKKQQDNPDTGLVFPSPVTGQMMATDAHYDPWSDTKKYGGLPEELHYYALRHHGISTMVAAGIPLLSVAKIIGHKSVELIERHYGHLCPDSAQEAMDVIEATISKAQDNKSTIPNNFQS